MSRRVVVTGIGCITPIGNTVKDFADSLRQGRSGAGKITRFDPSAFEVQIGCEVKEFSLDTFLGREAAIEFKRTDLSSKFALAAADQAMKDAGLVDGKCYDPFKSAILLGTGIGGITYFEQQVARRLEKGPDQVKPDLIPVFMPNASAANIAHRFGIHRRVSTGNTACSSATDEMGSALRAIRHGYYDVVITGGSEAAITPNAVAGFGNMTALTKSYNDNPQAASRPFDKNRDGFVIGEGAGVLVFEELEHARARGARIYAEVAGYGDTCDAGHITQPCNTGEYAAAAIQLALQEAGLAPTQVQYINAHGTSTPLGDIAETRAIKRAFGQHATRVPVSSTKSMHGHALGAAGGLEAIATLVAMKDGFVPPTINLDTPDPECDLDYVPNKAKQADIQVAISQNFGFGGHNSVMVFRKI